MLAAYDWSSIGKVTKLAIPGWNCGDNRPHVLWRIWKVVSEGEYTNRRGFTRVVCLKKRTYAAQGSLGWGSNLPSLRRA